MVLAVGGLGGPAGLADAATVGAVAAGTGTAGTGTAGTGTAGTGTAGTGTAGTRTASATGLSAAAKSHGGPLLAWGNNMAGQLGDGSTTGADTPIAVNPPRDFTAISARGAEFTVAVTPAGKARAWGDGEFGELGNGARHSRKRPVPVKLPRGSKVKAARAGEGFAVALTTSGGVLAWGYGKVGELGNGARRISDVPVRVHLPRGTRIKAVTAGDEFALALTTTGKLLGWGSEADGELGNGRSSGISDTPVRVRIPAGTKITAVSAGANFALAVTSTGRMLAWGDNFAGVLGDGTTKTRHTPVRVHLPRNVKVVSALGGGLHSLALTTAGRVLAWGSNQDGQLGIGTTADKHRPVWVKLPRGTRVTALAAGKDHSLALTAGGRVLAWGDNSSGQLGDGTETTRLAPVRISVPGRVLAIGSGPISSNSFAVVRKIID